jgi:prolipoprotein diacylglyceryltransferase
MLLAAAVLVLVDRRWRLGHGRVFALYVALYTFIRLPIELIRVDPATEVAGLRINVWVSGLLFIGSVAYFVWSTKRRPGRESPEQLHRHPVTVGDEPSTEHAAKEVTDG